MPSDNASKETSWETQGTQARKRCKGHDNARDASKAASRGRQQHKGGDRHCIVVVDATCNNRHINSNNFFFSSFNNVDLSHIILVGCCMLCCRECGPIAAVWQWHPPWWLNWIAFLPILPILPSFFYLGTHITSPPNPKSNQEPNTYPTKYLC